MRYGFVAEAQRIVLGLLDASERMGSRLPELFCGFDREELTHRWPIPLVLPAGLGRGGSALPPTNAVAF